MDLHRGRGRWEGRGGEGRREEKSRYSHWKIWSCRGALEKVGGCIRIVRVFMRLGSPCVSNGQTLGERRCSLV